jgi:hypothetical protein
MHQQKRLSSAKGCLYGVFPQLPDWFRTFFRISCGPGVTPIVIQDFVTAKTDNGDYQNPTDLSSNDVMQGFKAGQLSGDSLVWKGIEMVPNFRQHSQGLKTQEA